MRRGGKFEAIKGFANKAAEHALRLAGILSLVRDLECAAIQQSELEAGIGLVRYYLNEALRLYGAGHTDPEIVNAVDLLRWLHSKKHKKVSLVEIYQNGPQFVRQAKTARVLMKILIAHGWARTFVGGVNFDGALRHEAFLRSEFPAVLHSL